MQSRDQMQVLLLEEHPNRRRALADMLGRLGFVRIAQVEEGQQGLDLLERSEEGFELVICNLDMGGMDGLEFIRHSSRLGVGGLILYSMHDDAVLSSAEWIARAYNAPLLGLLRVPFGRASIEALVTRLHGQCTVYSDVLGRHEDADGGDHAVVSEIREGLDARQFVAHYQPKVCLRRGELMGVEALVRWNHPELGILAPIHFVDLMEANDLIDPLTHRMIEQAGRHAAAWKTHGLDVPISVNVSPLSLQRPDCAKQLLATIAESGAEPSQFVFEITEKAFAKDATAVLENIVRLRMRGCGISVDDFGTGYSSLQQLNRTPITELKLDRCFVRRVLTNSKASSIVESMIDLSAKLKLKTVAEGIDMAPQAERLLALGCDMGQGYLYAKAMPCDELQSWWHARLPVAVEARHAGTEDAVAA